MSALLVLAILATGFTFTSLYYPSIYKLNRATGWLPYFLIARSGFVFFLITLPVLLWIDYRNYGRLLAAALGLYRKDILQWGFSFDELKLIAWAISSFLLAVMSGVFSKLYYQIPFIRNRTSLKLVKKEHFEKVIVTNIIKNKENPQGILGVSLTLQSGKVYVGMFEDIPLEHGELTDFTITPLLSGYRNESDHTLTFTVNYIEQFKRDHRYAKSPEEVFKDYKVTIRRDQVETMSLFDPEIYKKFQTAPPPPSKKPRRPKHSHKRPVK